MNGTWTIEASGIQCAFEGIGRTGFGRDRPADLGEDPDEVDVEARGRRRGCGRRRRSTRSRGRPGPGTGAISSEPDAEGEQIEGDRGSHGRCSVAPAPGHSDRYESATSSGVGGRGKRAAAIARMAPDGHLGRACRLRHAECPPGARRSRRSSGWRSASRRSSSTCDRPARRRPRLLRRRRPPQRRPAAVRAAGDDQRGRVLPLPAAPRDPVPAAGAAAVRGGGGDLDGDPRRLLRAHDRPARARGAGRHGSSMGMLALPTGWSLVIGQAQVAVTLLTALGAPWAIALGGEPQGLPGARRDLVARPARRRGRSAGSRAGWRRSIAFQFVLEPPATIDFIRQFGLEPGRRRREPVALRVVAGPVGASRSSPASSSRGGSRRRAGAGRRRSRCRSSRRRGC